jgi:hypothetical protein
MPARSTVSNRNQMRQAREVLKALPPKQREELRYHGIGPGDSYIGMWRMVNAYRFKLNALCKAQARDNVTPIEERQLERDIRYYSEQITFLYAKLLVHEKPKLASVEFKGDQQRPIYQEVDLKILPTEDLQALARILPKLGGASGIDDRSEGRDLNTGTRGDQAPAGGALASAGRAQLRKAKMAADRPRRPS